MSQTTDDSRTPNAITEQSARAPAEIFADLIKRRIGMLADDLLGVELAAVFKLEAMMLGDFARDMFGAPAEEATAIVQRELDKCLESGGGFADECNRSELECPRCGRKDAWQGNGGLTYCRECDWWFEGRAEFDKLQGTPAEPLPCFRCGCPVEIVVLRAEPPLRGRRWQIGCCGRVDVGESTREGAVDVWNRYIADEKNRLTEERDEARS